MSSISVPAQISSRVFSTTKKRTAKLTLWPLVAATFFMVSGGTYGTEEIIHGAGYGLGILILLFLPVLWSLPTAFMIAELSSALPHEGGYAALEISGAFRKRGCRSRPVFLTWPFTPRCS